MSKSDHVTELMCGQLHDSHQRDVLELFFAFIFFIGPFRQESMDAMHTSIAISVAKTKIAQILREEVHVREADDTECIGVFSLNRSNKLLQNVNCIILSVIEIVPLSIDAESVEFVICLRVQNNNLARHVERFHPSL